VPRLKFEAQILVQPNKPGQALATLTRGLVEVPSERQAEAQMQRALLELQIGNRAGARRQLRQLATDRPSDLTIATHLAQLAWEERDWLSVEASESLNIAQALLMPEDRRLLGQLEHRLRAQLRSRNPRKAPGA
jgi:hypothetical protein